jgi:hypothetical protein
MATATQVKPGQWINVKVLSSPKNEAGKKTMRRLFEKDNSLRQERKRLKRSRPPVPRIRAGRIWTNRPPRLEVVDFQPGATYKIFGSVDVMRDLQSISDLVEVSPSGS